MNIPTPLCKVGSPKMLECFANSVRITVWVLRRVVLEVLKRTGTNGAVSGERASNQTLLWVVCYTACKNWMPNDYFSSSIC